MIRKFECKDCKTRFESEEANNVLCPNCHSDNVEYALFRIPEKVWKIVGLLAAVLIIVFLTFQFDWSSTIPQDDNLISKQDSLAHQRDSTYVNETGLTLPPVINVGDLTFEDEGYTFEVSVENRPLTGYYVAILNAHNDKIVISKSNDGKFTKIPFSEADGGSYIIALVDVSNDTIICNIEKPGFIRQKAVSRKMTIPDLQTRINKRDESLMGIGENDYLAPDYKLKFIGLPSDAVNIPSTLGEVFDKLDNEIWSSVKVNSLEYDDMNRISMISLSVKE